MLCRAMPVVIFYIQTLIMNSLFTFSIRTFAIVVSWSLGAMITLKLFFDQLFGEAPEILDQLWIAAALAIMFIVGHVLGVREMTRRNRDSISYDVVQKARIRSSVELSTIATAIKNSRAFRNRQLTINDSGLSLNTGVSWYSWGERITIRKVASADSNEYEIVSRPRLLYFQPIDFGKNIQNVEQMRRLIFNI